MFMGGSRRGEKEGSSHSDFSFFFFFLIE
uniref:Uncharacterized protein n=1 Tax=Anguilla anguilla TaxID=7936 RepID=A0A0E9WG54_ANGAN